MKLIDVTRQCNTEDKCLDYIEKMRWPNGELGCVYCGEVGRVSKITREAGKNKRTRIYQCLACGKQFSATSGTIFNDTHLPLTKWFMALALICEAKKGISAKQIERHLGVNYRTAWHLCHRIRAAMQDGGLLTGEVEADETYLGARKPRKGRPYVKKDKKDVVLGMIERGGKLRLVPVPDAKMEILGPALEEHISPEAHTRMSPLPMRSISSGTSMPSTRPSITAGPTAWVTRTRIRLRTLSACSSAASTAPSTRFR